MDQLTKSFEKLRDQYLTRFPRRYSVACFLFLGSFFIYTMRANLSVSIEPISCQYRWSNKLQGYALSSFFIGYFIGNVPSGYLSEAYGAKLIYGSGIFITSILTVLLPWIISSKSNNLDSIHDTDINCKCDASIAKDWAFINGEYKQLGEINDIIFDNVCEYESHFYLLCITRIITGLSQSVAFPSSYFLLSNWTISSERSRFVSIFTVGTSIGTAFTLFLCPILIQSKMFGWKYTFYVFGILSIIFTVFWYYLLYDAPNKDPWIKNDELGLLSLQNKSRSEAQLLLNKNNMDIEQEKRCQTKLSSKHKEYPWRAFLTHPVAWSLYSAHFCSNWTNYFILTMLPTYLNKQLKYDLSISAYITLIPLLLKTAMSIISSFIVDKLIGDGYNRWNVRRISQILATILPGGILVLCSYANNGGLVILFMSISIALSGIASNGHMSTFVEVSPTFSNIIYGISNSIATIPGVLAPIFSGYVLGESPGNEEWKILFYVAFIIHIIGALIFCYLGTTQRIPALNSINII